MDLSDLNSIVSNNETFRFFTSLLFYSSIPEAFSISLLLYKFRIFERMLGTSKFSMFVIFCSLWSIVSRYFISVYFLQPYGVNSSVSGPYELLFGLFVLFYSSIPVLYPAYFSLFQLSFNEKAWVYALGLQIFFNQGSASMLAAVSGVLFSALYFNTPLARLTWPKVVRRLGRVYLLPVIDFSMFSYSSGGVNRHQNNNNYENDVGRGRVQGNQYRVQRDLDEDSEDEADARIGGGNARVGGGPAARELPRADPEAVTRLVAALGFPREQVEDALRRSYNDENLAANRLLGM
jgi:UBA/TS-N domain